MLKLAVVQGLRSLSKYAADIKFLRVIAIYCLVQLIGFEGFLLGFAYYIKAADNIHSNLIPLLIVGMIPAVSGGIILLGVHWACRALQSRFSKSQTSA